MKIIVTIGELMNLNVWGDFCEMKDLNPWIVNEGLADTDVEFTLTKEEAQKLGILPSEQKEW